ncbi:MAG: hypothetical protein U1C97_02560, partial [Candidatus Gracilibacteria bacterium]|nr:hypothetical protein [Candidatus Gracilibacteria bacterium]
DAVLEVLESYDIPIPTLNIQIEYNPVTLEQPENYTSFESIDVKLGNTTYEALLAKKSPAHMVRLPGINPKIFVEQILKIALESLSSSNLYGNALVRVLMGTIESNNPNLISGLEPPLPEGISGEERDRTIENKALKNKDFLEALIRGFGWEKASFPYLLQSQGLDLDEDILGAAAAADRWKDIDPITIGRAIKALQRRENAELRARKLSTEDGSRIIVGANFLKAFLTESFPDLAKQLYSDTSLFERPQEGQKVLICYTTKQREMIIVSAVWQFTLLPIRTNNQGGKVEEEGVSLRPLSIILSFPQKNGDFKIFQGDPENPFDQMKIPQELGNKVFITPIDGSETDRFIQLQGKDNSKQ